MHGPWAGQHIPDVKFARCLHLDNGGSVGAQAQREASHGRHNHGDIKEQPGSRQVNVVLLGQIQEPVEVVQFGRDALHIKVMEIIEADFISEQTDEV